VRRRLRGRVRGTIQLLTGPTLALLLVLVFVEGRAGVALRLYALFVTAVVVTLAVGALRRALPPPRPLRHARPRRPARTAPASLQRLEDEIALGVDSAFDYHHRLRKRLRALAEGLLSSRRRISLERDPDTARRALGEHVWSLVSEERPPSEERHARGPTPAALADVLRSLERL
jgi:hypothetical protein